MYSLKIRLKARSLRKKGWTHREIGRKLGIALGTACLWAKGIVLTETQKKAIEERRNKGCFIPTFELTKKEKEKRRESARKNLAPYWRPTPTDKELIQRIINFYAKRDRIPFKREFSSTYKEYRKRFGSWNNAIRSAGFEPNIVIFSKKFMAKDGHICDSFAEKIIDDWLSKHRINHKRNYPYGNTKMTADFAVGNIRIEYFGLAGDDKLYDQTIQKKRNFCQKEKSKLLEIYPSDLFSKNFKSCLRKIFKELKR